MAEPMRHVQYNRCLDNTCAVLRSSASAIQLLAIDGCSLGSVFNAGVITQYRSALHTPTPSKSLQWPPATSTLKVPLHPQSPVLPS